MLSLSIVRLFFGLIFVSGFTLAYLKIAHSMSGIEQLQPGTYHLLITKFLILMGLGHSVMVGPKQQSKRWIDIGLILIAIASLLGLILSNH